MADNTLWIGAGVTTVAGLGWTAYRLQERAKLRKRLLDSSSVAKAGEWVRNQAAVLPSDNWLLTPEGIADKASKAIPIMGTTSADSAYLSILNGLPKKQVSLSERLAPMASDIAEAVPGGTSLYDSTRDMWAWAWGGPAPTPVGDPNMSWAGFLAGD